jgi:parvulin-like peptidyl-prolyl isomerase
MNRKIIMFFALGFFFITAIYFINERFSHENIQKSGHNVDIIAKIGSREISVKEFQQKMRKRGGAHPDRVEKKALLDEMIEEELLLLKAIEAGLYKDPEVLNSYRNLLIGTFKERYLKPRIDNVEITDAEIKSYYENHPEEFTRPARIRLALIYMAIPPGKSESKIRAKMAEIRKKAINSKEEKGFGKLCVLHSQDQATRYKGGDIGWVEEGKSYRFAPGVLSAGFALKNIGDISDILTTENGLYLVKLSDLRPQKVIPLSKTAPRIRHMLVKEKKEKIRKNFQKELHLAAKIETYPEILKNVSTKMILSESETKQALPPKLP